MKFASGDGGAYGDCTLPPHCVVRPELQFIREPGHIESDDGDSNRHPKDLPAIEANLGAFGYGVRSHCRAAPNHPVNPTGDAHNKGNAKLERAGPTTVCQIPTY